MRIPTLIAVAAVALPLASQAQGVTQPRSGLGTASNINPQPANGMPAGSVNATTGPQSKPAYPSGSTTANPGAAFVESQTPKPATGALQRSPGTLSTTTTTAAGSTKATGSPGVGQAATPPQ